MRIDATVVIAFVVTMSLSGCLGEKFADASMETCKPPFEGCTSDVTNEKFLALTDSDRNGSMAIDWPMGGGAVTAWANWTIYKFTPIQVVWIPDGGAAQSYPGWDGNDGTEGDARYALEDDGWVTAHHDDMRYETEAMDENDYWFRPFTASIPSDASGTVVITWANVPGGVTVVASHDTGRLDEATATQAVEAWAFGTWDEGTELWTPALLASFNQGVRFGSEGKHTLVNIVAWASNEAVGQLDIQSSEGTDNVPLREERYNGCLCSYGHRYLGVYDGEVELSLTATAATVIPTGQSTLLFIVLTEVDLGPGTTQRLTEVPYNY